MFVFLFNKGIKINFQKMIFYSSFQSTLAWVPKLMPTTVYYAYSCTDRQILGRQTDGIRHAETSRQTDRYVVRPTVMQQTDGQIDTNAGRPTDRLTERQRVQQRDSQAGRLSGRLTDSLISY